jgi:HEAT repeat protein
MEQSSSIPVQLEQVDQQIYRDFDEATHDLLMADSAAERAAAARKLGTLGSPSATAYLVAALYDISPEVRRAAAESLGHIGDHAAIGPLNDLLARETNGGAQDSAIPQAIHSITTRIQEEGGRLHSAGPTDSS